MDSQTKNLRSASGQGSRFRAGGIYSFVNLLNYILLRSFTNVVAYVTSTENMVCEIICHQITELCNRQWLCQCLGNSPRGLLSIISHYELHPVAVKQSRNWFWEVKKRIKSLGDLGARRTVNLNFILMRPYNTFHHRCFRGKIRGVCCERAVFLCPSSASAASAVFVELRNMQSSAAGIQTWSQVFTRPVSAKFGLENCQIRKMSKVLSPEFVKVFVWGWRRLPLTHNAPGW